MSIADSQPIDAPLPPVDERVVAPETRYEVIDGKLIYVAPSLEPHGTAHADLAAVLKAHIHEKFNLAIDMGFDRCPLVLPLHVPGCGV